MAARASYFGRITRAGSDAGPVLHPPNALLRRWRMLAPYQTSAEPASWQPPPAAATRKADERQHSGRTGVPALAQSRRAEPGPMHRNPPQPSPAPRETHLATEDITVAATPPLLPLVTRENGLQLPGNETISEITTAVMVRGRGKQPRNPSTQITTQSNTPLPTKRHGETLSTPAEAARTASPKGTRPAPQHTTESRLRAAKAHPQVPPRDALEPARQGSFRVHSVLPLPNAVQSQRDGRLLAPKVHIGSIEVRVMPPTAPPPRRTVVSAPEPLSRGFTSPFGWKQG
jgi:hypothetical protein